MRRNDYPMDIECVIFNDVKALLGDQLSMLTCESLWSLLPYYLSCGKQARRSELEDDIRAAVRTARKEKIVPNDPTLMDRAAVAIVLDAESLELKIKSAGIERTRAMFLALVEQLTNVGPNGKSRIDWGALEAVLRGRA